MGEKKIFIQPFYQATPTFHAPRVTSAIYGMHAGNTKFTTQNEE
jgi:hypothetical protein